MQCAEMSGQFTTRVAKHLTQQRNGPDDAPVTQPVQDILPLPPGRDEQKVVQYPQVSWYSGLRQLERLSQAADATWFIRQRPQDSQPCRIG